MVYERFIELLAEGHKKALIEKLRLISVFVNNGLDQDVTVQVKVNREKVTTKAVNLGTAFTVPAGKSNFRSLSVETSGWLPWIYVEVSCAVAPTFGELDIYRIRNKDDQVRLVHALEIRDTLKHDPDTDPTKIFIVEW